MSGTPRSNPELERALNAVTDPSQLHETLLRMLSNQGQVVMSRDRGDEFTARLVQQPQAPEAPMPAPVVSTATCTRVIYPSGNSRFELYGVSESDLDSQEQKIRQMYGGQR